LVTEKTAFNSLYSNKQKKSLKYNILYILSVYVCIIVSKNKVLENHKTDYANKWRVTLGRTLEAHLMTSVLLTKTFFFIFLFLICLLSLFWKLILFLGYQNYIIYPELHANDKKGMTKPFFLKKTVSYIQDFT